MSPSSVLQEKVRQWVRSKNYVVRKKLIGKSRRKHGGSKRNPLKEIQQIDVLIKAAGQRLTDATNKKNELLDEKDKLSIQRNVIEQRVISIEITVRSTQFVSGPFSFKN